MNNLDKFVNLEIIRTSNNEFLFYKKDTLLKDIQNNKNEEKNMNYTNDIINKK